MMDNFNPLHGLAQGLNWYQQNIGGDNNVGAIIRNPFWQKAVFSGISPLRLISPGDDALQQAQNMPTNDLATKVAFANAPWQRLAATTAFDPLTYVGAGLPGKAAGLASKIPMVGDALETGLNAANKVDQFLPENTGPALGWVGNHVLAPPAYAAAKVVGPMFDALGEQLPGLAGATNDGLSAWRSLQRINPGYLITNFLNDRFNMGTRGAVGALQDSVEALGRGGETAADRFTGAYGLNMPESAQVGEAIGTVGDKPQNVWQKWGSDPVDPYSGVSQPSSNPFIQAGRGTLNKIGDVVEKSQAWNAAQEAIPRKSTLGVSAIDALRPAVDSVSAQLGSAAPNTVKALQDAQGLIAPADLEKMLIQEGVDPVRANTAASWLSTKARAALDTGEQTMKSINYDYAPDRWGNLSKNFQSGLSPLELDELKTALPDMSKDPSKFTPDRLAQALQGSAVDPVAQDKLIGQYTNAWKEVQAQKYLENAGRNIFSGYKFASANTPAMLQASIEHPGLLGAGVNYYQTSDDYNAMHGNSAGGFHGSMPLGPAVNGRQFYFNPSSLMALGDVLGEATKGDGVRSTDQGTGESTVDAGAGPLGALAQSFRGAGYGLNPLVNIPLLLTGQMGRTNPPTLSKLFTPLNMAAELATQRPVDMEGPIKSLLGDGRAFPYADYQSRRQEALQANDQGVDPSQVMDLEARERERALTPEGIRPAAPANIDQLWQIFNKAQLEQSHSNMVTQAGQFLGIPGLKSTNPVEQAYGHNEYVSQLLKAFGDGSAGYNNPSANGTAGADPLMAKIKSGQPLSPEESAVAMSDPALRSVYLGALSGQLHGGSR